MPPTHCMVEHPSILLLKGLDINLCRFGFTILLYSFQSPISVTWRPWQLMPDWIFSNQRFFGRPREVLCWILKIMILFDLMSSSILIKWPYHLILFYLRTFSSMSNCNQTHSVTMSKSAYHGVVISTQGVQISFCIVRTFHVDVFVMYLFLTLCLEDCISAYNRSANTPW